MLVVVHVLEEFLDERKKDNQSFMVFVILRVKQSVDKVERMPEFRSF
jgi:hypothetical protein